MRNLVLLIFLFLSLKSSSQQTLNKEYLIDISKFKINTATNQGTYVGTPLFVTLDVDENILIDDNTKEGEKKTTYFLHYKISSDGKIYFITGNSLKGVKKSSYSGISISETYNNNQKFIQLLNEYLQELHFSFYKNGKKIYNLSPFSEVVFSNVFTFNIKKLEQ